MRPVQIQTKFQTLAGWETGNPEGEAILAFHGWLDNANSFLALAPFFPEYRFISMDFSGHGKSGHKPPGCLYHFAEYCVDIVEASRQLSLDKFHLLAHSMGAAVSTLVAGTQVLPLRSLTLIEAIGPISNAPEETPQLLRDAMQQILHPKGKRETYFPDFDSAVSVRGRAGDMAESSVRILMERGLEKTPKGLKPRRDIRLHLNSLVRLMEAQIEAFCSSISVPVVLILGDESMFPIQNRFEERKNSIRDFREVVLPGGHHLHMDSPESVAHVVRDFYKEIAKKEGSV